MDYLEQSPVQPSDSNSRPFRTARLGRRDPNQMRSKVMRKNLGLLPLAEVTLLSLVILLLGGTPLGVGKAEAAIQFRAAAQSSVSTVAAPNFQAAGTAQASAGALTVPWPAHQADDIGLLIIETANQAVTLGTNGGDWTEVTNSPQGTGTVSGGGTRLTVFWSRATSSSMGDVGVNDSTNHQRAQILTFRGVFTSGNPWDGTPAGDVASTASTAVSIPGGTTTVANTLVVAIVANATDTTADQTSGWTNAGLTTLTEREDGNTGANNGGGFGVATGVKATAGAYAATTATLATASAQGRMSIALRPSIPLTIALPTGTVQDDVMVASIGFRALCCVADSSGGIGITPPTGWTPVRRLDNGNSTSNGLAVYQKVAGASEPASYTWEFSCTGNCDTAGFEVALGGIASFSGVDTASPIDVENGQSTPSSKSHLTPDVTTTVANTMLVTSHDVSNAGTWQNPPPSGMTQAFQGTSGIEMIQVSYALQATAGATGQKQATDQGPDGNDVGNAHILALRPICAVAPSEAAYVAANAQPAQATVYWSSSNPALILRKSGSSITDAPNNGTSYNVNDTIGTSTVVYNGSVVETSFNQGSLTNTTTYYYKVFAKSGTCYSPAGTEVNARPEAGPAPAWSYMMANGSTMRAGIAGEGSLNSSGNFGRIISLNTSNGTQMWTPVATNGAVQSWLTWLPLNTGVKLVQTGTATMPVGVTNAPETVNVPLSTPLTNLSRSVLFFTLRESAVDPGDGQVRGQILDVNTLQFNRANDTSLSDVTIQWTVVEFMGGVYVQRGTIVATDTSTATINAVDPSKTFTLISCSVEVGDATYGSDDYFRSQLTNATTLEVVQSTTGTKPCDWQVVEYAGASVQRGIGTLAAGTASSGAIGISSVDTTKSFVHVTWKSDGNGTGNNFLRARVTGPTEITIDRAATGTIIDYSWEVVSFTDGTTVQSGNLAFGTGQTSLTAGLSVDPARAVAFLSAYQRGGSHAYTADDEVGPGWFTATITDGNTLTVQRQITQSVAADAAWFVVQFPAAAETPTVLGGDQTARVYSVDAATGATNWTVNLTGSGADTVQAAVAAQLWKWSDSAFQAAYGDDVLFVATRNASSTNNKVFALRASDGGVLWTFNPGNMDYIVGMPWVDYARNRVYVASRSNGGTQASLWALNGLNGSLVTSRNLNDVEASPTMSYDGNTLYVANLSGDLYAINLNSPTLANKWPTPFPAGDPIKGFIWEDWNTPGRLYFATSGNLVWCITDNGGTPGYQWATVVSNPSTPLPMDTLLYVGSSDGKVHQLRLSDGNDDPAKRYTVGSGAYQVGDVSTETWTEIFVPTTEGKLYKLPLSGLP